MNTDDLIKFLKSGEQQWKIPWPSCFSDKELIKELSKRGYIISKNKEQK